MRARGFTLVEIMIVVAILGLLVVIGVPSFLFARNRTQRNACMNNIRLFEAAKEQYAAENGLSQGDAISPPEALERYLTNLAINSVCPGGGSYAGFDTVGAAVTCSRHGGP